MDVNNATIKAETASGKYDIKTPEQKRMEEFRMLVHKLVVEEMGNEVNQIDDIRATKGEDAMFEYIGHLLHRGVEVGLMHQAAKINGLNMEIKELRQINKKLKKNWPVKDK